MKKFFIILVVLFSFFSIPVAEETENDGILVTKTLTNEVVDINIYVKSLHSGAIRVNELVNETVANLKSIGFKTVSREVDMLQRKQPLMIISITQIDFEMVDLVVNNRVSPPWREVTAIGGEIDTYEFKTTIIKLSEEILGKLFLLKVKKVEL